MKFDLKDLEVLRIAMRDLTETARNRVTMMGQTNYTCQQYSIYQEAIAFSGKCERLYQNVCEAERAARIEQREREEAAKPRELTPDEVRQFNENLNRAMNHGAHMAQAYFQYHFPSIYGQGLK